MQEFNRTTQPGAVAYFRDAIKNGNVKAALSCFDVDAVYIDSTGKQWKGLLEIEFAMQQLCALKPHISGGEPHLTVIDHLTMWMDKWEMTGTAPNGDSIKMTGHTSCLMKKNEAGFWLWLVDNPFGSSVLEHALAT